MSVDIFEKFVESSPTGVFEKFKTEEKSQNQPRIQSLIQAPIKGIFKGASQIRDPNPFSFGSMIPDEVTNSLLEQVLPTQKETPEEILEKTGELLPFLIGGEGSAIGKISRALSAAALGKIGKELGGSTGETIGELTALGFPSLTKKILPTNAQKKLVDFARSQGLSEEQIAPLIQSELKQNILGKIADKGDATKRRLQTAKKGAEKIYQNLESSKAARTPFSIQQYENFENNVSKILNDIDPMDKKIIQPVIRDLFNEEFNPSNLMKAYRRINRRISKGYNELGRLKEPIENLLQESNPEFAEQFSMARQLYRQGAQLRNRLKPKMFDTLMKLGRYGRIVAGLITGNYPLLLETVGEQGAKRLASNVLTNPRFQNINQKIIKALNENKFGVLKSFFNELKIPIILKKGRVYRGSESSKIEDLEDNKNS